MAKILTVRGKAHYWFILGKILEKFAYFENVELLMNSSIGALHLAQSEKLDLLIIDVNTSFMTNYELVRTLKANPNTSSIPILVIGYEQQFDAKEALEAGCDDYTQFPFDAEELVAKVRAMLNRG